MRSLPRGSWPRVSPQTFVPDSESDQGQWLSKGCDVTVHQGPAGGQRFPAWWTDRSVFLARKAASGRTSLKLWLPQQPWAAPSLSAPAAPLTAAPDLCGQKRGGRKGFPSGAAWGRGVLVKQALQSKSAFPVSRVALASGGGAWTSSLCSRSRHVKKGSVTGGFTLGLWGWGAPFRNLSEVLFQTCRAWS